MPKRLASTDVPPPTIISSLPYPVTIGSYLEPALAAWLDGVGRPESIIVCDERVITHAKRFANALPTPPPVLTFKLGEQRKHLRTVELVLDALAKAGADRKTVLIGVGGGVAGDLFGFVASAYMRGIRFINIATSVVAMVDASIGGKTGVDLRAGKNLAGAFADPMAVFAAVDTLQTLPSQHVREGLGEVVKHAILDGETALAQLEAHAKTRFAKWPWQTLVADSMRIKAAVVLDDRLEQGRRELLNLGHTFAHGFEYASSYRITHGAAVAIGLRAAGLLAQSETGFAHADHARIMRLLHSLHLPLFDRSISTKRILAGMAADKKTQRGTLRFVLPEAIGRVRFGVEVADDRVRSVLDAVRKAPAAAEFRDR